MYKDVAQILVILGALNWGLVALQNMDLVQLIFGAGDIDRVIKVVIGAAAAYYAYTVYSERMEGFMAWDGRRRRWVFRW